MSCSTRKGYLKYKFVSFTMTPSFLMMMCRIFSLVVRKCISTLSRSVNQVCVICDPYRAGGWQFAMPYECDPRRFLRKSQGVNVIILEVFGTAVRYSHDRQRDLLYKDLLDDRDARLRER